MSREKYRRKKQLEEQGGNESLDSLDDVDMEDMMSVELVESEGTFVDTQSSDGEAGSGGEENLPELGSIDNILAECDYQSYNKPRKRRRKAEDEYLEGFDSRSLYEVSGGSIFFSLYN